MPNIKRKINIKNDEIFSLKMKVEPSKHIYNIILYYPGAMKDKNAELNYMVKIVTPAIIILINGIKITLSIVSNQQ